MISKRICTQMGISRSVLSCVAAFFFSGAIISGFMLKTKKNDSESVKIPIDEKLFRQKISSPAPEWMIQNIRKDLEPFLKTRITRNMLNELFQGERISQYKLIRFTISAGKISVALHNELLDKRAFRHLLAVMEKLGSLAPLPDVDFVLSLQDGFDSSGDFPSCPCFCFSKTEGLAPFVLIPDFKALTGYPTLQKEIIKGSRAYPWEKKKPLAFWRGTTSGGYLTKENWGDLPRLQLALLSLKHPKQVDARVVGVEQADPEVFKIVQGQGLLGRKIRQKDHLNYKYLIDVDGNSCAFERYFWTLLSNSVVFKQITNNRQWYYGALEPYRHYIPVKKDLSDLLEKISWANDHDDEVKAIADQGTEFVKNHLSIESNFLYLYTLIKEYALNQS